MVWQSSREEMIVASVRAILLQSLFDVSKSVFDGSKSLFDVSKPGELCMESERDPLGVKDGRKFELDFDAGDAGELRIGAESLLVKIGQRIRRDGYEEMWHSVVIQCAAAEDGSLCIKVILCHFDWEEPRQIALIQSSPNEPAANIRTLTFYFDQRNI
jgi:hypothetical protein